jgi:hypothetical protein
LQGFTGVGHSESPQDLPKRHVHLLKVMISGRATGSNLIVLKNSSTNDAYLHQND